MDNYVGNVYKGHFKILSLITILLKIRCKIRIFVPMGGQVYKRHKNVSRGRNLYVLHETQELSSSNN